MSAQWAEHYTCLSDAQRKQAEAYEVEARAYAVCPTGDPNGMEKHCIRMARSCRERAVEYAEMAYAEIRKNAA